MGHMTSHYYCYDDDDDDDDDYDDDDVDDFFFFALFWRGALCTLRNPRAVSAEPCAHGRSNHIV